MNLPAYLQHGAKKLNESALLGIGSALPPHISIRGNNFTLVDASGAQQVAGRVIDVCIADLSDVVCKQFYADTGKLVGASFNARSGCPLRVIPKKYGELKALIEGFAEKVYHHRQTESQ